MDEKKQENVTRLGMRDHIRERLDYLRTRDNNAPIPLVAIEVALSQGQDRIPRNHRTGGSYKQRTRADQRLQLKGL